MFEAIKVAKNKHDELLNNLKSYLNSAECDFEVAKGMEAELAESTKKVDDAIALASRMDSHEQDFKSRSQPSNSAGNYRLDSASDNTGLENVAKSVNIGREWVQSDQFKKWNRGDKHIAGVEIKATLVRPGTTGAEFNPQLLPGVYQLAKPNLGFTDLFSQATTQNTRVSFVRESSYTNAASGVLEGNAKPEAAIAVEGVNQDVSKIAVIQPVTEEMLADFDGMESFINNTLSYMVTAKKDEYSAVGTGTAPQYTGLLNTTGIQTGARGTNTVVDAIYVAISNLLAIGYAPDAIVFAPEDWQKQRTAKATGSGEYLLGSPVLAGADQLWGLPVIQSNKVPVGTAIVGAFKVGGTFWTRQGIRLDVSDSNKDYFEKNILTLRCETRGTLVITKPKAFYKVTGLNAV